MLGTTSGQVGIGANGWPQQSAILDVTSTRQGVFLPRMTTIQRDSINGIIGGTITNPGSGQTNLGNHFATITSSTGSDAWVTVSISGGMIIGFTS